MLIYKELPFLGLHFESYSKGTVLTLFQNILRYALYTCYVDQINFDKHFETIPYPIERGFVMSPVSISPNPKIVDPLAQPLD